MDIVSFYDYFLKVGLNEMVRIAKYGPGGRFSQHCDESFYKNSSTRSWLTVRIVLKKGASAQFGLKGTTLR